MQPSYQSGDALTSVGNRRSRPRPRRRPRLFWAWQEIKATPEDSCLIRVHPWLKKEFDYEDEDDLANKKTPP
jgi:hypothetical protein